ncbi:MAG: FkbM family methyltransferase [Chryseosolibacter sp.]
MVIHRSFIKLLHRTRLLKHFKLNTRTGFGKSVFKIPLLNDIGYSHCLGYEEWLLKVMAFTEAYLHNDKSFVDVGVNIGQSLLILKSLYPATRYTGFEPNPVCVEYAQELIKINNIQNSAIYPFGLSDKTGAAALNFYHQNPDDSCASMVKEFRNEDVRQTRSVSVVRGDELENWPDINPGIVKIDVEGAELEVIIGLENVIRRYRPCIICEVLPAYSIKNEFRVRRQEDLRRLLTESGYGIYQINENGDITATGHFDIHAPIACSNYLFVPLDNNILD